MQYDFANKQILVQEAYITAAFRTKATSGVIFQLHGERNAHISCYLINGAIHILFNFQTIETSFSTIVIQRRTDQKGFNDDLVHVVRVHHKGNKVYAYLLDDKNTKPKDLNITGVLTYEFPKPQKLYAGKVSTEIKALPSTYPTTFVGCMPGVKYQYLPAHATRGVFIDLFALYAARNTRVAGTSRKGKCLQQDLPIPGPLPTVLPPLQFKTAAPTRQPIGPTFSMMKILVVAVIAVLVIIVVILFGITCRCIEKYNRKYKPLREEVREFKDSQKIPLTTVKQSVQKPQPPLSYQPQPVMQQQPSYQPQPTFKPQPKPQVVQPEFNVPPPQVSTAPSPAHASAKAAASKGDDDWFL